MISSSMRCLKVLNFGRVPSCGLFSQEFFVHHAGCDVFLPVDRMLHAELGRFKAGDADRRPSPGRSLAADAGRVRPAEAGRDRPAARSLSSCCFTKAALPRM